MNPVANSVRALSKTFNLEEGLGDSGKSLNALTLRVLRKMLRMVSGVILSYHSPGQPFKSRVIGKRTFVKKIQIYSILVHTMPQT